MKTHIVFFFVFAILALLWQNLQSQSELVGLYGVTKVECVCFDGDSAFAVYQTEERYLSEKYRFLDYFIGLPDSLPNLPDGKYLLFNTSIDSTLPIIRQIWYIKNNQKDSVWISYNRKGKLDFIIHFKNGQPFGRQRLYDYDGNKIADWHVANNSLNGPAWYYDKYEGVYFEGEFKNGAKDGLWISYIDTLAKDSFYIEEIFSGDKKYIHIERIYISGVLVEEKFTNKNGSKTYKDGVLVKNEKFRKTSRENKKHTAQKKTKKKTTKLKGIKFDKSLSNIDTTSFGSLFKLVDYLTQNDSVVVELSFHTSFSTENETPQWMLDVVRFLMNSGINPNRIIAKNYSNKKPLLSEKKLTRVKNEKRKNKLIRKNQRIEYSIIRN